MKKTKIISKFIRHRLKGKNRHGIHSPFVFDFLDKVLYGKGPKEDSKVIEACKKDLLRNKKSIQITDLGAGSSINSSKIRTIADITKNSTKKKKYGKLFYRMVAYFEPANVIELGTSMGLSTTYFAMGLEHVTKDTFSPGLVHTIEGCPQTLNVAHENFQKMGVKNIHTYLGDFSEVLPKVLEKVNSVDFVFFDGNHQKAPTLSYFESCLPYVNNDSVFIFDDIHWSDEMTQAWEIIKGHPQVKVTLDLFFIGIVFFNSDLTKQHFDIKF